MISPVFGHRSELVFSSPIFSLRETTLDLKIGSKIPPHFGPKIPKKLSGMGIVLTTLFGLWLVGLCFFFFSIPTYVADSQTSTQAVIVLTGGRERLKTGFQILCAHQAQMIFISGVHPDENLQSLLKLVESFNRGCHQDRELIASHTYIGHAAKNTKENAIETAAWIRKMSISSLRLVTAAYHMPRSLLELKRLLPEITIIPHPVFPKGFRQSHWWENEGKLYLVLSEYHKFLWAFVRINKAYLI